MGHSKSHDTCSQGNANYLFRRLQATSLLMLSSENPITKTATDSINPNRSGLERAFALIEIVLISRNRSQCA